MTASSTLVDVGGIGLAGLTSGRKFLVVMDETPESRVALRYGAFRARSTQSTLVLLRVVEPIDFQHWAVVGETMRGELYQDAEDLLETANRQIEQLCNISAETVIKEGSPVEAVLALIDADPGIRMLVLGAAAGPDGPGPLVTALTHQRVQQMSIPITVVPPGLDDETLAVLTQ